jgi:hypothetical protein
LPADSAALAFCGGGLLSQAGTSAVASGCAVAQVATHRRDALSPRGVVAKDPAAVRLTRLATMRLAHALTRIRWHIAAP